jgi:hypothetical protein
LYYAVRIIHTFSALILVFFELYENLNFAQKE